MKCFNTITANGTTCTTQRQGSLKVKTESCALTWKKRTLYNDWRESEWKAPKTDLEVCCAARTDTPSSHLSGALDDWRYPVHFLVTHSIALEQSTLCYWRLRTLLWLPQPPSKGVQSSWGNQEIFQLDQLFPPFWRGHSKLFIRVTSPVHKPHGAIFDVGVFSNARMYATPTCVTNFER